MRPAEFAERHNYDSFVFFIENHPANLNVMELLTGPMGMRRTDAVKLLWSDDMKYVLKYVLDFKNLSSDWWEKPLVSLHSKIIATIWTGFMEVAAKLRPALQPLDFAESHSEESFVDLILSVDSETTWSDVVRQDMGLSNYAAKEVIFSRIQSNVKEFRLMRIHRFPEDDRVKLGRNIWFRFTKAVKYAVDSELNVGDLTKERYQGRMMKPSIMQGQTVYDPNLHPGEWAEYDHEDVPSAYEEEPPLWYENMGDDNDELLPDYV